MRPSKQCGADDAVCAAGAAESGTVSFAPADATGLGVGGAAGSREVADGVTDAAGSVAAGPADAGTDDDARGGPGVADGVTGPEAAEAFDSVAGATATGGLTRQQRDALFDNAANGMTPDHQKKKPEDPVRPWIPQILRKHKQGFSSQQIAAMSRAPGIGLNLSVRAVNRVIVQHKKAAKPGTK